MIEVAAGIYDFGTMQHQTLRWGILGTANIARKNWKAIWNSGNSVITAVASRNLARAQQFIEECQSEVSFKQTPRPLGSYQELLAAADVDAVYIPLPTGIRAEWVKRAAQARKHVICEKPCARSVCELEGILEVCRANKVQFMDGVMFMHSERLERIGELLKDKRTLGEIRRITSAFSFCGSEEFFATNMRAQSELEPAGCLGDLGWYCIRFSLWAMDWQLPRQVTGRVLSHYQHPNRGSPVPTEFSAELLFDGGVSSSFYCSFRTADEQWAMVSGTEGQILISDFVLPFSGSQIGFETAKAEFKVQGCEFEMLSKKHQWRVDEYSHSHTTAQESMLFRNFAKQVLSGSLNTAWPEMALKTQMVMEACIESASKSTRCDPVSLS